MTTATAPRMLTVLDVAERLRTHKQTVYRLIYEGDLAWTDLAKKGAKRRRIRISETALIKYLSGRERA